MLNVANLYPEHFNRILSGAKRTEWRARKRPDSRLESVRAGEPIVLLETGSNRAIRATVAAANRFDCDEGHVYGIRIKQPELFSAPGVRRIQGWHRRESL